MKDAVGIVEILIVVIIGITLCLFFNNSTGRKNPFEEVSEIKHQQQVIDDKIEVINDAKKIRQRIENNLKIDY